MEEAITEEVDMKVEEVITEEEGVDIKEEVITEAEGMDMEVEEGITEVEGVATKEEEVDIMAEEEEEIKVATMVEADMVEVVTKVVLHEEPQYSRIHSVHLSDSHH